MKFGLAWPPTRRILAPLVLLVLAVVCVGHALAGDALTWRATPKEGCDLSKESGRAVLVVTLWKEGVCNSCDTWRSRVRTDEKFLAAARKFESVEWIYDGLDGKVIPWTLANGGTSRDPSAQAFVLSRTGSVIARCPTEKTYLPSAIADWLDTEAANYERDHPTTAVPLKWAEVSVTQTGTTKTATCEALDTAVAAGRPVLIYVGRDLVTDASRDDKLTKEDRARRTEGAQARDFERRVLDAKSVADAAGAWTLLRLDLADDAHAALAQNYGVEHAPAVVLIVPGEAKPSVVAKTISVADFAFRLRKASSKDAGSKDAPLKDEPEPDAPK